MTRTLAWACGGSALCATIGEITPLTVALIAVYAAVCWWAVSAGP